MSNEDYLLDLGPCCACGKHDNTVRNMLMLEKLAPVPGKGWGCFVCDLPMNGALAIVCDQCLENKAELKQAIYDDPAKKLRCDIEELQGHFTHDLTKHEPEIRAAADLN
ncbi:MAG: hypothetical protein F6K19_36145 [Cyanothece sp. SIO1E1]|nr:hypothetical protein [Cyanothece sp. SIO1E1]